MTLIVSPAISDMLPIVKKDLPHALLLSGERGVGLATVAYELADGNVEIVLSPRAADGTESEAGTISVERIRQLYDQTRGVSQGHQVIIIDDADRLSPSASGALLKLLEEPPANTHFILTTHAEDALLPTIRSRARALRIPLATKEQTDTILEHESDSTKRRQLEFMAAGRPAELFRLMGDEEYFNRESERFSRARQFLTASRYQKLLIAASMSSQLEALRFCDAVLTMADSLLRTKAEPRLVSQLERVLAAREKIATNGNIKLNLLRSMV